MTTPSELSVEGLEASVGWEPIETAPKDGSSIILGFAGGYDSTAGFWSGNSKANYWEHVGWFDECDRGNLLTAKPMQPTHWQPLPSPPAHRDEGEGCHNLGSEQFAKNANQSTPEPRKEEAVSVGHRPDLPVPCAFDECSDPAVDVWFAPEGCICKTEKVQALCLQHSEKAIGNGVDLRKICTFVVEPPSTPAEPQDGEGLVERLRVPLYDSETFDALRHDAIETIERLQRERDQIRAWREGKNAVIKGLNEAIEEYKTERDRLREALEEITSLEGREPANPFLADSMARTARAALSPAREG